jgi:integrase
VFPRGKRVVLWIGRWREDIITPSGEVKRVRKSEVLGTKKDYPTKRLALRALEDKLTAINDPSYKATPTITFRNFAQKWTDTVLAQHDKSTQSADRSRLRKHLLPALGDVMLKDFNPQRLQAFISRVKARPKSVKNMVALLRIMWSSAKAWGYVRNDPFDGLVLPKIDQAEQPMWDVEKVQELIAISSDEYGLAFWLDFETGIRRGELCALDVRHVDLENAIITVRYSCTGKFIKPTKSRRPRVFSLSPQLVDALRMHTHGRRPDEPLFLSKEGKRLLPDNLYKRVLKPLRDKLGLKGGFHAMRHGNATALDGLNAPMKVRQDRLGHIDPAVTMGYTHLISADDRRVSAQLGALILNKKTNVGPIILDPIGPNNEERQAVSLP